MSTKVRIKEPEYMEVRKSTSFGEADHRRTEMERNHAEKRLVEEVIQVKR